MNRMRRAEAGFTLVELLVSLAVTAVLILGVLATFDLSARMNRVQMHVADMQQSLRIAQNEVVRFSRMAARGVVPANLAVQVTNNVPAGTLVVPTKPATEVQEGTDILRVRGVINSTVYQIDTVTTTEVFNWNDGGGTGWVLVFPTAQGVPQDLAALKESSEEGETLLLLDPNSRAAVVEIVEAEMDGPNLRIEFKRHPQEGVLGTMSNDFKKLVSVGILEDYAFYVRVRGGETPSLARARMEPGSDQPYQDELDNATLDLADNILDLQAAYGLGVVGASELRVTTLARTDRADPGAYLAPQLPDTIEDHAYPAEHPYNSPAARRYRWRLLRTD
ncbi:MAG TPA: prepilin-type N-terminal cleavage/methylation domain-containing protein, partial [Thermoanaerobaculia bacterium]